RRARPRPLLRPLRLRGRILGDLDRRRRCAGASADHGGVRDAARAGRGRSLLCGRAGARTARVRAVHRQHGVGLSLPVGRPPAAPSAPGPRFLRPRENHNGEQMKSKSAPRTLPRLIASFALAAAASACGPSDAPEIVASDAPRPNEATVLLAAEFAGAWPTGLDPATNTTAGANTSLMNAIFGGLFQLTADEDGTNPRITGVLASGYEIADDGRTIVVRLREGLRFSDGTPLDADAVRFNVERALRSPCVCAPTAWPWDEHEPVRTR